MAQGPKPLVASRPGPSYVRFFHVAWGTALDEESVRNALTPAHSAQPSSGCFGARCAACSSEVCCLRLTAARGLSRQALHVAFCCERAAQLRAVVRR